MPQPQIRFHLVEIRTALGLSIRAVEKRTQKAITKSWLQRVEAAESTITLRKLLALAEAYQTSPWALVEFPTWPVPQPCTCPCHSQREG